MTARPAPDLFADRDAFSLPALEGVVPNDILAGLATLAMGPPLWGNETDWREMIDKLQAFAARWYYPAAAAGWTNVQLFGLDPVAPRVRLDRMGASFIVALRAHQRKL
jgi:hypothetical protein